MDAAWIDSHTEARLRKGYVTVAGAEMMMAEDRFPRDESPLLQQVATALADCDMAIHEIESLEDGTFWICANQVDQHVGIYCAYTECIPEQFMTLAFEFFDYAPELPLRGLTLWVPDLAVFTDPRAPVISFDEVCGRWVVVCYLRPQRLNVPAVSALMSAIITQVTAI